jgi:hypothetical protein
MHFRDLLLLPAFLITILAGTPAVSQLATKSPAARAARWQEDLNYFAAELPARQIDFFRLIPQDQFERQVNQLRGAVSQLTDAEIILLLSRLVASLGVGETSVYIWSVTDSMALHSYPIQMKWFSDGLAIVAAAPEYKEALGCRVVKMGSKTPEEVELAVAPYIAHENGAWLHFESPRYMGLAELMQNEKIADSAGHLSLTCAKIGGKEFTVKIAPLACPKTSGKMVYADDALHIPTALCRKQPNSFYWYEYLPRAQTLYIQYNRCTNAPGYPFVSFAGDVLAFADAHPVQRVIMDLRFNQGGGSEVVKPLEEGLKSRPILAAPGHLYTLTDSGTFGAGTWAANDFHSSLVIPARFRVGMRGANDFRQLHALLVGEPTGGKPNHYGRPGTQNQATFLLPNSKLAVAYTKKYFILIPYADPLTLAPDIFVPYSLSDFLSGRDPALEAALHQPQP